MARVAQARVLESEASRDASSKLTEFEQDIDFLPAHSAIFELLGSSGDSTRDTSARRQKDESTRNMPEDLLATLNDQYCQALESPHFRVDDDWVGSSSSATYGFEAQAAGEPDVQGDDAGAIRGLLRDIEKLEEAFGPLQRGGVPDLAGHEAIPEVLRLFAPPEYHAAAARRAATALPHIARRDHHALAIDSPLAALNSNAHPISREPNE